MAIPNYQHVVDRLMREYPEDWRNAHTGNAHTEDFIRRLAWVLHSEHDPRFGLLGKRGNPNDLADDAILYQGEGPGHDPTNGNQAVSAFDVIIGAGGPDPRPSWGFINLPGPAAWVPPSPVGVAQPQPQPTPQPQPEPQPAPACKFNLGDVNTGIAAILLRLGALEQRIGEVHDLAANAEYEARQSAGRASEIKDQLARGFHADLRGRLGMSLAVSGDVRPVEE